MSEENPLLDKIKKKFSLWIEARDKYFFSSSQKNHKLKKIIMAVEFDPRQKNLQEA
jgi:hypothetical protein